MKCPSCREEPSERFLDARAVEDELALRRRLLPRGRDLTDVALGTPADILRCARCGILIRDDAGDDVFREDRYCAAVLRALHELHSAAFRAKRSDYRALLPRGARVVEIGSYAGGFLRAASEWGWRGAGVDIGADTARFTASLGFEMSFDFASRTVDGVFVWNCFEQLADPRALLAAARDALRDDGVLVLRVPDVDVYVRRRDLRVLAANGFLGWPHRHGFGVAALRRMAAEHGFALCRVLRRAPLPPLPATHRGWLELTFRKSSALAAAA
jgi:SAM-dependent methyltransferase